MIWGLGFGDHRHVDGGHAEGHARQLALDRRDHLFECLRVQGVVCVRERGGEGEGEEERECG